MSGDDDPVDYLLRQLPRNTAFEADGSPLLRANERPSVRYALTGSWT